MPVQASTKPGEADSRFITERARALGFALVGFAPAQPGRYAEHVRQWIAEGRHGEMNYLANHLDVRLDPRKLVEGAKTVVCVADKHAQTAGAEQREILPGTGPLPGRRTLPGAGTLPGGRIARYAFGRDYHKSMKTRLHTLADELRERHPDHTFRCTVDTAPILEREFAALAGLGWIGKHTLLIHPRFGSYFLLGTMVTTLDWVATDTDGSLHPGAGAGADHCGTCTRCIDACPTQCINSSGARALDATHCISYLTLEHRSVIDPSLHEAMGDWVAGCDVCQEVCPHNRERTDVLNLHPDHTPRPPAPALDLIEVLSWNEDDRRRVFQGSALKRMKLDMIKRNALIALGNALAERTDPAIRQHIERLAGDEAESELVRITARQVLARLGPGSDHGD